MLKVTTKVVFTIRGNFLAYSPIQSTYSMFILFLLLPVPLGLISELFYVASNVFDVHRSWVKIQREREKSVLRARA